MAKLAYVTYGTDEMHPDEGQKRYVYVVNDNVRVHAKIAPSVKHYKSGKIFGTTAVVRATDSKGKIDIIRDENGKVTIQGDTPSFNRLKQELEEKNAKAVEDNSTYTDGATKSYEIARTETAKDVGAKKPRNESGKFTEGDARTDSGEYQAGAVTKQTRTMNVLSRMSDSPNQGSYIHADGTKTQEAFALTNKVTSPETFDSYSERFK